MKPYYDQDGITIYHGDCRDLLPAIDAAACVTDPPYGETSLDWDRFDWRWLGYLRPNSLWCFGSLRFFMRHAHHFEASRWKLSHDIVWEKHNGSSPANDRFRRVHELAAHFYRGEWAAIHHVTPTTTDATARAVRRKHKPPHWSEIGQSAYESHDGGPRLQRSVIAVRSEHGRAEHPTQKPIGIVRPLVEYACPAGGLIVDPFAGSGSILVAARDLGRRAIGIEIEERYCEIAARRLSQTVLALEVTP